MLAGRLARGVVLHPAGPFGNVLRLILPSNVSDRDLVEGIGILDRAIAAAAGRDG